MNILIGTSLPTRILQGYKIQVGNSESNMSLNQRSGIGLVKEINLVIGGVFYIQINNDCVFFWKILTNFAQSYLNKFQKRQH